MVHSDIDPSTSSNSNLDSFEHLSSRLNYLEKWYELAVRPTPQLCHRDDKHMLLREKDDLDELEKKCLKIRHELNERHLPPNTLAWDDMLVVRDSSIPNAGSGLFYEPPSSSFSLKGNKSNVISSGEIICYYTGHRHNFLSQKHLSDKSYLMNVAGDILVDPGPVLTIKARYINDPLNDKFINCKFVPEPCSFRCAVVATRNILPGEELFVSYGEIYWSQQTYDGTILTETRNSSAFDV